jgi:hypothetical protein
MRGPPGMMWSALSFVPARNGRSCMKEHAEAWKNLCEQAAFEQDPQKLLDLIQRINQLLDAKKNRLSAQTKNNENS